MQRFAALDYFEDRDMPLLIAVNTFDRARRFDIDEIREALGVGAHIPSWNATPAPAGRSSTCSSSWSSPNGWPGPGNAAGDVAQSCSGAPVR